MRFQKIVKNVHHNSQKSKIVSSNILFGQSVYYQIKKKKKVQIFTKLELVNTWLLQLIDYQMSCQ